ncbi:MAG: SDR family NAD(P)-dependent oxidoreductase [Candidatus Poribacteria bacterium]
MTEKNNQPLLQHTDSRLLAGKIALVSGGARPGGISEKIVESFISQGAAVAFIDIDPRGEKVAHRLQTVGGECLFVQGDLRQPEVAEHFVQTAADCLGPPQIVVNVVGGSKDSGGPMLLDTKLEQLMNCYMLNVGTAFNLTSAALPYLNRQSGDKSVICIGSVNGQEGMGFLGEFSYSCAKSSLGAFVRCAASAYARFGVRFNLICPGSVPNPNSATWAERLEDRRVKQRLQELYPLGRWGTPEDVSNMALFLASELSSWITGQTFYVDGGLTGCGGVRVRPDGKWWLPEKAA